MILRVGPFNYRVRFVEGYIDHEGQPCLGLCDNDTHELFISTVPGLAQQIQVIGHEYLEAWIYHFGANLKDKEDYCDLFGLALAQFVLDLTHQLHRFSQTGAGAAGEDEAEALAGVAGVAGVGVHRAASRARQRSAVRAGARHATPAEVVGGGQTGRPAPSTRPPSRPSPPDGAAAQLATLAEQLGLAVQRVHEPAGGG